MSTFKNDGKTGPRTFVLGAMGACALGVVVTACSSAPGSEDGASGATSESAAVTSDATTTGIASIALANRGKGACSTNSRGGHDFDSSCTGNGDRPEFWCADFARWVWDAAGVEDTSELTAAAGSFYVYGENHGTLKDTPEVGDAVVFDYHGGGRADHVALVTQVNSDGTIETISGDWNGCDAADCTCSSASCEANFSSTSHVVLNTPAYKGKVGDTPGIMGMTISGFVRGVGATKPTPTPVPPKPTACGLIEPGHGLKAGESHKSCDGKFELAMETDGDLVWTGPPGVLWSTDTKGKGGLVAVMQTDGNFVLYDADSHALWASHTDKHAGDHLALQDDGNLVVYDTAGKALWASGTNLPKPPPATVGCGLVQSGHGLTMGESFSSCGDEYTLSMQTDGNLVLYQNHPRKALWATGTEGKGGFNAVIEADGNFVLYDWHDKAIWESKTNGHAGSALWVQTVGNLAIYEDVACEDGGAGCVAALWDSNTAPK